MKTQKSLKQESHKSHSPAETMEFGRSIAGKIKPGTVIALVGELGSGKTTLVKGIGLGLGLKDAREVRSPSFVIFHIYKGRIPLYHFDLYRLSENSDLTDMGLDEYLWDRHAVSVIEWADRIPMVLKQADLTIELVRSGDDQRLIRVLPRE